MDKSKEEIAFVCTKSLINICKDLKTAGEPVLANLCLFIAKTLTEAAGEQQIQIHTAGGEQEHKTTIKEEIQSAIDKVKKGGTVCDDFGQPGD